MSQKLISLFWLLSILAAAGCSRQAHPEDVDKAASQFFERLREAKYDAIYDDAAESFKSQNARAAVIDNLKQIISYGRPHQWSRLQMAFADEGRAQVALPVYAVQTDQAPSEVALKFIDDGGQWKLLGFAFRPRGTPAATSSN
jgi:hypothetical protein